MAMRVLPTLVYGRIIAVCCIKCVEVVKDCCCAGTKQLLKHRTANANR